MPGFWPVPPQDAWAPLMISRASRPFWRARHLISSPERRFPWTADSSGPSEQTFEGAHLTLDIHQGARKKAEDGMEVLRLRHDSSVSESRFSPNRVKCCAQAEASQIQRVAAAPVSSGRVLKAMAALGAARWMALTKASNRTSRLGGSRTPAPITTQS